MVSASSAEGPRSLPRIPWDMTEKGVSRRTWERRRRSEIAVDAVWTVRPNSQVEIPDVYATPLRQAGWLDYVVANVDQLDFVRAHYLILDDGTSAIGLATVIRGRRMAQVTTLGRSPLKIAEVIVHEAAHLDQRPRYGSEEDYAMKIESRFSAEARNAQGVAPPATLKQLRRNMQEMHKDVKRLQAQVSDWAAQIRYLQHNIGRIRWTLDRRREFNAVREDTKQLGGAAQQLGGAAQQGTAVAQRYMGLAYYYGETAADREFLDRIIRRHVGG